MNDLLWMLPYESKVQQVDALPESYQAYGITSAAVALAFFPLGIAITNFFPGSGFSLWITHYLIENGGTFYRKIEKPAYELLIPFVNNYKSTRFGETGLEENQFNLYYVTPGYDEITVAANRVYSFFCVRFESSFLHHFAASSPGLSAFINRSQQGTDDCLLAGKQYLDPRMIVIMNQVLRHDYQPVLVTAFMELKVTELLIALLHRMTNRKTFCRFTNADLQKGEAAKQIIMKDFEKFHTIRQLARLVGTNEHKLKAVFRYLYGTTIFDYSRKARLEYARQLLHETDWTLQHIALAVGYPEASNFSIAFKQHFGYAPGFLKKNIHQYNIEPKGSVQGSP